MRLNRKANRKLERYLSNPKKVLKDLDRSEANRKRQAEKIVKFNENKNNFTKARAVIGSLFAFIIILYFIS